MTSHAPLVSIVIPMYNQRHDFLRATVASVLAQTYPNFECVVSDNHSTNGAGEVLASFSDTRLRVVRPETHVPLVPSFQFVGTQARGEFISFLPSDDLVEPDWIESLLPPLLKEPQAVFAFGEVAGVNFENPGDILYHCRNNQMASGHYSIPDMLRLLVPFNRNAGWLVGDLMRIEAYRAAGGIAADGLRYAADHSLALRLLELGSAVYLNKLVGRHRCWGHGEGKADGNRSYAAVSDTLRLYEILESSAALRPHLAGIGPEIARAKKKKAAILSLLVMEAMSMGILEKDKFKETRDRILSLDNSHTTRSLLALAGSPAATLVGVVRKPARKLYHATLGPMLNRS